MDLAHLVGPLPLGEHQVALQSLRPRRGRRHLAGGDPVAPVGEHPQPALATEARHPHAHLGAALPHPDARVPRVGGRVVLRPGGMRPRELAPDLVTAQARLHVVEVLVARAELLADAVAARAGARELVRLRRLDQRQPVAGRIDRSGFLRRAREGRLQPQVLTRHGGDGRRVHQPVPPHPHRVARFRQLRQQEPAVVIRHHDLAELRRQVAGLGDDPDAGLGTHAAGHEAGDGRAVHVLRAERDPRRAQGAEHPDRRPFNSSSHRALPQILPRLPELTRDACPGWCYGTARVGGAWLSTMVPLTDSPAPVMRTCTRRLSGRPGGTLTFR